LAVLLQAPALSAQVTCRDPSERSAEVQQYLVFLATSADSQALHTREQTGLPMVPAHTVVPITDAAKCAEAGAAINSNVHEPRPTQALWLFSYGTGYAALTPDMPYYDGTPLFLFDRDWAQIFATGFYHFSGPSRE
jgi:hypothetical protein